MADLNYSSDSDREKCTPTAPMETVYLDVKQHQDLVPDVKNLEVSAVVCSDYYYYYYYYYPANYYVARFQVFNRDIERDRSVTFRLELRDNIPLVGLEENGPSLTAVAMLGACGLCAHKTGRQLHDTHIPMSECPDYKQCGVWKYHYKKHPNFTRQQENK